LGNPDQSLKTDTKRGQGEIKARGGTRMLRWGVFLGKLDPDLSVISVNSLRKKKCLRKENNREGVKKNLEAGIPRAG